MGRLEARSGPAGGAPGTKGTHTPNLTPFCLPLAPTQPSKSTSMDCPQQHGQHSALSLPTPCCGPSCLHTHPCWLAKRQGVG